MSFDGVLLSVIARLALAVLIALLGLIVLLRGRRLPWLFSGAAAFLLGIMAVRIINNLFGISLEEGAPPLWEYLVLIGAAIAGGLAGRQQRTIAYGLIGLSAGGSLGIWLARLFLPEGTSIDFWSGACILLLMGAGMLFVLHFGDVALILLSAGVGVGLIANGLGLPVDSPLVAAAGLAAAIASIVIQYHDYLVELRLIHQMQQATVIESSDFASGEAGGPVAQTN